MDYSEQRIATLSLIPAFEVVHKTRTRAGKIRSILDDRIVVSNRTRGAIG